MKKKVVLAFSGGLDTSFSVQYLKDKGYDVVTMVLDTGGLSEKKLKEIADRSKELGAIKHIAINEQKETFDNIITCIIKANGLYEGVYPNMCADRYVIAKHLVNVAKKEGTTTVAHGCTGAGNDQVRIDVTIKCLAPEMTIITPIRELGIIRPEEIDFLEKRGFAVSNETKKYSINENIFGRTVSGSEIDNNEEPAEGAWELTTIKKREPEYFEIEFEKGVPVALNGKKMHGLEILKILNKEAGEHGYGRVLYIEDEIVGIKGYQAFEAPGLLLLIEAHRALERLTLTRVQLITKQGLESTWSDLAYRGMLYEPVMKDIQAFFDASQQFVTGKVRMKVHLKTAFPVGVFSPYALIREDVARYAQKAGWAGAEAEAFIKLYSMQQKIASLREKEQSKPK